MKPRDLFGVAIRALGAWQIVLALSDLYYVIVKVFHLPTNSTLPLLADYVAGAYKLVLGLIFLVAANGIVRLVYGREPQP